MSESEFKKLSLQPNEMMSVNVLKGKNATDKYGGKGKDGVVEITLKSANDKPLYLVNNKIVSEEEANKIQPAKIESVNVLKGKNATDKYGDKGKNGVVEIKLKATQETKPSSETPVTDTTPIFTQAEKEPQFPGGAASWHKYLERNANVDVIAKKGAAPGTYTVTVSFLVDENGKVSEVKALNNPGYGAAAEAERLIAKGPMWIPAEQNGHKVTYREKQNISFKVD
jgi:protein TonB